MEYPTQSSTLSPQSVPLEGKGFSTSGKLKRIGIHVSEKPAFNAVYLWDHG